MMVISIIGAGGHTRSLLNLVGLVGIDIDGIYDNAYTSMEKEFINGVELKGDIAQIPSGSEIILSVGDCTKRLLLYEEFSSRVYTKNIVHPSSLIEVNTAMGRSNQIFADVYINSNARVGENNIINTKAIIEHETVIGNHNHISVGSILCGRVKIGDRTFIGAGAIVVDKISICDNVTIGANAVVVRDILEPGIYVGNPARRIR